MNIIIENEFPRRVDGIAIVVTQNFWSDGGVSYSLRFEGDAGVAGELIQDEDFDHMPTDSEVRDAFENYDQEPEDSELGES